MNDRATPIMSRDTPPGAAATAAVATALAVGLLDWLTGYRLNFFVFYFVPISMCAWFLGLPASIAMVVFSTALWISAHLLAGGVHLTAFILLWNTIVRFIAFLMISWLVSTVKDLLEKERARAEQLHAEVRALEAILPICCVCKKIRDDDHWQQIESYIGERTGTRFSHSYCPECARKVLAEAGLGARGPAPPRSA